MLKHYENLEMTESNVLLHGNVASPSPRGYLNDIFLFRHSLQNEFATFLVFSEANKKLDIKKRQ